MTLLQYFKAKDCHLLKANSSLSEQIPKSSLLSANKEVKKVINTIKDCRRGPYKKYPPKAKAGIAKYAAIHGVTSALHHHAKIFPSLKESTVRTWRNLN